MRPADPEIAGASSEVADASATTSAATSVGPDLPDAVVFDLDGTLVDTESISDRVLTEVLDDLGHEVTDADLLTTRGRAFAWLRDWLWERFEVSAQDYRERARPAWERGLQEGVPTFRDAIELLAELRRLDVPLAVCTSSGRNHLDRILDSLDLADAFAGTVSASDVSRHKPDPMPYRLAVELLDVAPGRSVAIEDTVVGATAAVAAGLRVVGRPHPDMADLSSVAHVQVDHLDLAAVRAAMAGVVA